MPLEDTKWHLILSSIFTTKHELTQHHTNFQKDFLCYSLCKQTFYQETEWLKKKGLFLIYLKKQSLVNEKPKKKKNNMFESNWNTSIFSEVHMKNKELPKPVDQKKVLGGVTHALPYPLSHH